MLSAYDLVLWQIFDHISSAVQKSICLKTYNLILGNQAQPLLRLFALKSNDYLYGLKSYFKDYQACVCAPKAAVIRISSTLAFIETI